MKVVVLFSGGVDSTTCLALAIKNYGCENVTALSICYGQKHKKEIEAAKKICEFYDVSQIEMNLSKIYEFSDCNLLSSSTQEIPEKSYSEQIKENGNGRVTTFVPFRNGLMLSTAAAVADSLYPNQDVTIYYGAHADDAAGEAYADCSFEFVSAMKKAIKIGTYNKITVEAPLVNKNKEQVVKKGIELDVPYQLTWSCYKGLEEPCGTCATCIDRNHAFIKNGIGE